MKILNAVADLKLYWAVAGENITCNKYYTDGGLVAGLNYLVKTSAQAATDGDVVGAVNHAMPNNMVAVLKNTGALNVLKAGMGNGFNDSSYFQAALDFQSKLYVPDGDYFVKNIVPNNYNEIECESDNARFQGVTASDNIFATSAFTIQVKITGGRWHLCNYVWYHTGDSSLAYSVFEAMYVRDCVDGFNLSTSVGNDWVRCNFGINGDPDNIRTPINFAKTGTGATNINNFFQCKFLKYSDYAVKYADTAIQAFKNSFTQCWFEDGDGGAIYIGGTCNNFTIENNHFESNANGADILIEQSVGGTIRQIDVKNNRFSTVGAGQTERIKTLGNSSVVCENNNVFLSAGVNFVKIESSALYLNELYKNYLNAVDGGLYESRLYTKSASQLVSWSVYMNSGFVNNDDIPSKTERGYLTVGYLKTDGDNLEVYVATTGSDTTGLGTVGLPFATVQRAVDSLPRIITNDVVINIADGVYTDIGGQDEFGRPVCVDVSRHLLCVKRDSTAATNEKKAKLIFRGASEAGTIIDGTDSVATRYVFWVHEVQGVQFEDITARNSYIGIISHQNADVTLRDVTTTGCDFGRMIESNSRMEVLRGTNTANIRNYFIKNGQLQENDSTISASTENNFLIDGEAWIYLLRTDMTGTASKNQIDSTGAVWMEFDDCDISAGNNLVIGSYSHMRLSNGTRVRDFTSAAWANEAGYTDTDGLCHIHNNSFIAFITKGTPVFNLDNADSLNASVVDEPNTSGIRIQGSATSVLIDPDITITSADKILSRPTSGLIFKGTAPPAVVTTYYEQGSMCLNEGGAVGQPAFWICTTKGFGGVAVFTAGANL